MKKAIIATGAKQYLVSVGDQVAIEAAKIAWQAGQLAAAAGY